MVIHPAKRIDQFICSQATCERAYFFKNVSNYSILQFLILVNLSESMELWFAFICLARLRSIYVYLCLNDITYPFLEAVFSYPTLIVRTENLKNTLDLCICKMCELFTSIYFPVGEHFHCFTFLGSWQSTLVLLLKQIMKSILSLER